MEQDDKFRSEIAPGVFFVRDGKLCSLLLKDGDQELICWDFNEVSADVNAWYATLKAVAIATKHGPGVVKSWVETRKQQNQTPAGSMYCNVCGQLFITGENHPYVFSTMLNGKKFFDLQCSERCNKERKTTVYTQEIGKSFFDNWNQKFTKGSPKS